MNGKNHEILTVKEMRDILKIRANNAYNLIHSREFPVLKIGNIYRIPSEPFYAWLNHRSENAATF